MTTTRPDFSLVFKKLDKAAFDKYLAFAIPNYAEAKVLGESMAEPEAFELADHTFNELLPQREQTPNQFMYELYLNERHVGYFWWGLKKHFNPLTAFVYDVVIFDEYQGHGLGQEAMLQFEDMADKAGARRLALNVFGYNQNAQKLYKKMGYHVASMHMAKTLPT